MKKTLLLAFILFWVSASARAQSFEVSGYLENHRGYIGDLIKAPIQIKNISGKAITLILRKDDSQIGSTQRSLICPEGNCEAGHPDDLTLRLEPGQSQNLVLALDAGLVSGFSTVRYVILNKSNHLDASSLEINFSVEEKPVKSDLYSSRFITIHDVYPNPVSDFAHIDYRLLTDKVKAKILIHNILGSALSEYELPYLDNRVKIRAEEFTAGIYFYTLYLDNEGVMTRKLIVKR
ncbi:MAG: T9SS type A sorting domain-containing protein [Cyclobacteriaceae bacterium]|nr:T9SS type A sorting domain-containing protein [Cyclobacteriaceae bacterium]UYN88079.1 MAG: T9SS type A sorting domain-containing protein [Cyclobacteriaceae bacterium]